MPSFTSSGKDSSADQEQISRGILEMTRLLGRSRAAESAVLLALAGRFWRAGDSQTELGDDAIRCDAPSPGRQGVATSLNFSGAPSRVVS